MTLVVPAEETLTAEASAVSLARYAQIIRQPPNSFWGVAKDAERGTTGDCFEIFTKSQRDLIARYLAEAQEEIETEIGFFLSPRYVVGTQAAQPNRNDRYVDDQAYANPVSARWPKVVAVGVRATVDIALGTPIVQAADPAVIGPIATTVTDPREIYVYHPGTDVEINPSAVTISGGNVTIKVPRARTVLAALADNPATGLEYTTLANFETTVDVKRVYTDPATAAELVSAHSCSSACSADGCSEHTSTACIYLDDPRLGILTIRAGTYSDGAWIASGSWCCRPATRVRLNYLAGLPELTRQAEDTIVRLAHAKMPRPICGCDFAKLAWDRDRHVPDVLTRERINCPWGLSDGSWQAWLFARSMKQMRGSVL